MSEKIAVIGSNAFTGAWFCDLLLEDPNVEVLAVSRSPEKPDWMLPYKHRGGQERLTFLQADLNADLPKLLAALDDFQPSMVVTFAALVEVAPSWDHPVAYFRTNAMSTVAFGEQLASRDYLKSLVHISTPEVYGSCPDPIKEDGRLNPSTPYAASKAAADLYFRCMAEHKGLPVTMIRSTNVYGAYQPIFKIIPRTLIYARSGRTLNLHGGGVAVKSFIHVKDVCEGILEVARKGTPGEIYHFSPDDNGIKIRDLVEMVCTAAGKRLDEVAEVGPERLGQDSAYVVDSSKARAEFGWKPKISLEQGVAETKEWIDRHWGEASSATLGYQHRD
tara:strand:- start:946 stop:1944 length:999 start_codon:yes stop_codon:yes gene_type:complete